MFSSFAFKLQRLNDIKKVFKVMFFFIDYVNYSTEKIVRCYTMNKIHIHPEKPLKIERAC